MTRRTKSIVLVVVLAAALTLGLCAMAYRYLATGDTFAVELDLSDDICENPAPHYIDGTVWYTGQSGPREWDELESISGELKLESRTSAVFTASDGTELEFTGSENGFHPMLCSARN